MIKRIVFVDKEYLKQYTYKCKDKKKVVNMSILAKFRKIIFRLSFFTILCKRLLLKTVNQSQYIWDSKIIQQAATTSEVDPVLAD